MQPFTSSQLNRKSLLTIPVAIVVLTSLLMATAVVHAQSPDFALSSTPSGLCVNPGVNAVAVISVQSVNGFTGTVNLARSIDPAVSNGPTLSSTPSSETLSADQSVNFDLAISTTTSTPLYTYTITVSGISGGTFHQTTVQLTVAAGCSVGGVVLPTAGLAATTSYVVPGLMIAGLVGVVGATLVIRMGSRKLNPNP
jgi:hypothetical protein